MLFGQISEQHLAHERRALGLADHQNPVNDQRAVDLFVDEFEVQLVGDRQAQEVRHRRSIKCCQQGHGHERAEFGRIGHVCKHLHHTDQCSDHPEGGGTVTDCPVDFLSFVEMRKKIIAIALEVVANEISIVAIGNETDTLGKEWIFDLDLLEPYRTLLSRNLGETSDFIHQVALAHTSQREGEFGAERKSVKN